MERIAPQWIVENLEETINFYANNLGFKVDWKGTLFAIINKGGVTIMIRQLKKSNLKKPNKIPFTESGWNNRNSSVWDAYIWIEEVEDFYESIKSKNINIIKGLETTDYGNKDFEIEDNNGYIICFGKVL